MSLTLRTYEVQCKSNHTSNCLQSWSEIGLNTSEFGFHPAETSCHHISPSHSGMRNRICVCMGSSWVRGMDRSRMESWKVLRTSSKMLSRYFIVFSNYCHTSSSRKMSHLYRGFFKHLIELVFENFKSWPVNNKNYIPSAMSPSYSTQISLVTIFLSPKTHAHLFNCSLPIPHPCTTVFELWGVLLLKSKLPVQNFLCMTYWFMFILRIYSSYYLQSSGGCFMSC